MLTSDDIFNAVQSLAPAERWQLVTRLWDALPDEVWGMISQDDFEEIQRRSAEFDAGNAVTVSREQVRQRIRERLGDHG
jgi:putative addiction module component (TIGR02574 family)